METLAALVARNGSLSEVDAVAWAIRLAKRVEALHRFGVAHGALSPEAVQVAASEPRSSATLLDVRVAPTVPACHSPERQGPTGVSMADDAWAVASTLFFLLTGAPPFPGSTIEEVRQRMAAASPPPLAVFGVDDDGLQRIMDRFLARNPAQRVARVAAMRELLENWSPEPALRNLPPLEEAGPAAPRSDEDDEDVATQMRDVGDLQAILAQARASVSPPAPAKATAAAASPARPPPQKGTLLGFAAAPAVASPAAPPSPMEPPQGERPIQPTMRSLGVPAAPPAAESAPSAAADDDEVGATLMMDAGPIDVSAAIEDALRQRAQGAPPAGADAVTTPYPNPPQADLPAPPPPGPAEPAGWGEPPAQPGVIQAAAPPYHAQPASMQGFAAPQPPAGFPPPGALAPPSNEGRGLKIALAVGVVLLVLVVGAVALLYLRQQGRL